ncbi:hypothetical protein FRC16_006905 [Serendipita sp. 398]|nr:hypothetical protein FRC16_006905 [Serendipita sp. 398]
MALKPSMSPYLIIGERQAPNTLEMFWDYVCPYSGKSANAMETILKPLLESKYPNKVKVIFRPQPQPCEYRRRGMTNTSPCHRQVEKLTTSLVSFRYSNFSVGHSSSTLVHEAGLAVSKVAPNAFWQYSLALFKAQDQFYDVPASTMTPSQIREKLADLGKTSGTLSDQEVEAVKQALVLNTKDGARNGGVSVTDDLKLCSTSSSPPPCPSFFYCRPLVD